MRRAAPGIRAELQASSRAAVSPAADESARPPERSRGSAAPWADGLAGITLDLDPDRQNELYEVARAAWAEAGRPAPHLATSFWFALGDPPAARAQIHRHLRHYMNWIPVEYVDAMAPTTGWAGTEEQLLAVLRSFAAVGTSEVHLIPTSSDRDQLRRVADVVSDFTREGGTTR